MCYYLFNFQNLRKYALKALTLDFSKFKILIFGKSNLFGKIAPSIPQGGSFEVYKIIVFFDTYSFGRFVRFERLGIFVCRCWCFHQSSKLGMGALYALCSSAPFARNKKSSKGLKHTSNGVNNTIYLS